MNFKQSLDRYLTSSPDFTYDNWVELVTDNYADFIPEEFYDTDIEMKWFEKLQSKEIDPQKAAKIINRAYLIFIKNNQQ